MNQGKSTTFWVVLAVVGACLGSTALTGALVSFGLFTRRSDELVGAPIGITTIHRRTSLPTGETPELSPGMPGWLPSGRGVPIPEPRLVGGKPEGLWWHHGTDASGKTTAEVVLFLPDGTRAANPRLGGGTIFDREGQAATTGLDTFEIADATITQQHAGGSTTARVRTGSEEGTGLFMEIGGDSYWPLARATEESLGGAWTNSHETLALGTHLLDGSLLQWGDPARISIAGLAGNGKYLIVSPSMYQRR